MRCKAWGNKEWMNVQDGLSYELDNKMILIFFKHQMNELFPL